VNELDNEPTARKAFAREIGTLLASDLVKSSEINANPKD